MSHVPPLCRYVGCGIQMVLDAFRQFDCIVVHRGDEAGIALTQEAKTGHEQAGSLCDASCVDDVTGRIEYGHTQPGIVAPETGCPDDSAYCVFRQVEVVGRFIDREWLRI